MEIRSTVAEWPVGKNKSWSEQDWPISVWWPSSRTGVDGSARAASAELVVVVDRVDEVT